jgi:uncharacterized membrane protein
MDTAIWAKVHGAATHFPFALVLGSAACDGAGFAFASRPLARDLRAAGYWTLLLGAFGSVPAVFSGLAMTRGVVLGHGALRWHHLFVWPAFALVVGLATWRVCIGRHATRLMCGSYLAVTMIASALILAAGYWGGEMTMVR